MTDRPEPSSGLQGHFQAAPGPQGAGRGPWPTWLRWTALAGNFMVTLAFLALVPPLLGASVVYIGLRLADLPPPTFTASSLPWLYLLGFILAPSTILSFIGAATLIQQTIKATRRK